APAPTNCTSQGTFISQTLSAGTYTPTQILTLYNFYPCNQAEAAMSGFEITLNVKVFKTVASNTANYGGVRVKTLTDYPAIPSNAPASVNSFTYADASNVLLSSGVIAKEPTYQLSFLNSIGSHNLYRSTAFNPEALSPLYYKNVKVSTSAYETTHSFTSHGDQTDTKGKWGFFFDKGIGGIGIPGILFNESTYLEMGDFGNYYFMRSLPKEVVVKDIAGNLKQKTTYEYTGYNQDVFQVPAIHYELLARYEVPLPGAGMDNRSVYYGKAYYIIGGWPRKTSEIVTNYGSDGTNPVTTTINYEYGTNHLQLSK
ncbi:hypothetical protein, partial [Dyadobacter sp. LHD-138]|uniref:hypothetical protein n=1 Tax=Dyadobacter sp. LHD-138 TaxID=3071413 RepID=UPI0027DFC19C